MERWFAARGPHRARECPVCRAAWRAESESQRREREAATAATAGMGEGDTDALAQRSERDDQFLNLGALQGVSQVRDASTYSSWLEVHQRRREQERLHEAAASGS